MSGMRAEKSGFARDAELKVKGKWDGQAATIAMDWVESKAGVPFSGNKSDMNDVQAYLGDGYVLALLANFAKPGCVPGKFTEKRQTMAFKKMEVIGKFLDEMKKNNFVEETELFQTVDLYESCNMPNVITTIEALGRSLQRDGRGFGKARCEKETREWTDEQMKAGQSIIGLQMGTNKGANQAGLNMGKTRAIMD